MSGLLLRALEMRKRQREDEEVDAIPLEERNQIFSELDAAVGAGKMRIGESTFLFSAEKKDALLPVIVNCGAVILIALVSLLFVFYYNKAEIRIIAGPENTASAESSLIRALRDSAEEELNRKDQEINQIQNRLNNLQSEQEALTLQFSNELSQLKSELEERYQSFVDSERSKLEREGQSGESLELLLSQKEEIWKLEMDKQLESLRDEQENIRLERDRENQKLKEEYEMELAALQEERTQSTNREISRLAMERDGVREELASLEKTSELEALALKKIGDYYSEVSLSFEKGDYEEAGESLDELALFLKESAGEDLHSLSYRENIDFFLIDSLKKLMDIEQTAQEGSDQDVSLISSVSALIEEGNNYFSNGNMSGARESYIQAISLIPVMGSGYSRLIEIDEMERQALYDDFLRRTTAADAYFSAGEYGSALAEYKQALQILTHGTVSGDTIAEKIIATGLSRESLKGNVLVTAEELILINEAKAHQEVREKLLDELSGIESRYSLDAEAPSDDQEEQSLATLLKIKVEILAVLASGTIKTQYPDLHEKLRAFLQAYEQEKMKEGRIEALREIEEITRTLSSGDLSADQSDQLLRIFKNLRELIEKT